MESTGKYWIPVYNILEGTCTIVLAHPKYVKAIRGKKTDKAYTVSLQLKEQYLGDISRYQAQIDALEEDRTRLESDSANMQDTIQQLTGQLAEADETAIALFEELEAARAENPEAGEPPAPDVLDPAEAGEVTQ